MVLAGASALYCATAGAAEPAVQPVAEAAAGPADELYARAMQALLNAEPLQAQALLQQLMRDHPYFAAAWLDLALLHCALGEQDRADALWNDMLQRFDPPAAIVELVVRLRARGCTRTAPAVSQNAKQRFALQLGRGHTNNANQGLAELDVWLPSNRGLLPLRLGPEVAQRADNFYLWQAFASTQPKGFSGHAWAQWQGQWFDHERAHRNHSLVAGWQQPWSLSGWQGQWLGSVGWYGVDGASQMWRLHGMAQASPAPSSQSAVHWQIEVGTAWQHFPQWPAFDGYLSNLSARWQGTLGSGAWLVEAGLLHEAAPNRPGGTRSGWQMVLGHEMPLGELAGRPLQLQARWQQQRWRSSRPYAPGLIDLQRLQTLQQASVQLRWLGSDQSAWVLQWASHANDENIALFAHRSQSVQLGWQRSWSRP